MVEIRDQLKRIAKRLGITLKSCDRDMEVRNCTIDKRMQVFKVTLYTMFQAVRKAVTAGFFANACRLEVSYPFQFSVSAHPFRFYREINISSSSFYDVLATQQWGIQDHQRL